MNNLLLQRTPSSEITYTNSLSDKISKGMLSIEEVLKSDAAFNAIKRQNRPISYFICQNIEAILNNAFSTNHDVLSNRAFQFLTANNSQIILTISTTPALEHIAESVIKSKDYFLLNRLSFICQITLNLFPSSIQEHFSFIPQLINFADETSVFNMFQSFLSPDPLLSSITTYFENINFLKDILLLANQNCNTYLGSNLYFLLFRCSEINNLKLQLIDPSVISSLSSSLLPDHQPNICPNAESQLWHLINALLSENTQQYLVQAFLQAISEINALSTQLLNDCSTFSLPQNFQKSNDTSLYSFQKNDIEMENISSQLYKSNNEHENLNDQDDHENLNDQVNELIEKRIPLYYELSRKKIPDLGENICNAITFCANFLEKKNDIFSILSQDELQHLVSNASLLFCAYPDHSFALHALSRLLSSALLFKATEQTVFKVFFPIMISSSLQKEKTTLHAFARQFARKVRFLCGKDPNFDQKITEEASFLALCNTEIYHDDIIQERNYGGFQKKINTLPNSVPFSFPISLDA